VIQAGCGAGLAGISKALSLIEGGADAGIRGAFADESRR